MQKQGFQTRLWAVKVIFPVCDPDMNWHPTTTVLVKDSGCCPAYSRKMRSSLNSCDLFDASQYFFLFVSWNNLISLIQAVACTHQSSSV